MRPMRSQTYNSKPTHQYAWTWMGDNEEQNKQTCIYVNTILELTFLAHLWRATATEGLTQMRLNATLNISLRA